MANFTQWDYPTNYSGGENISSISDFFLDYPGYITAGATSNAIALFVFLAIFTLLLPFGVGGALASAGFISFILTTYLWWNGALGILYPLAFFSLTLVAAIIVGNQKN